MKNIWFLLSLLIFLTSCEKEIYIPKPEQSLDDHFDNHPMHASYQNSLENYRKETNSPGVIMLIHRSGEPLWAGSAGHFNLEHKVPMQTNTSFRTGSITKMFISALVLKLTEQNILSLTDTLSILLPKVYGKIPNSDKITVQHLLAHLSGIIDPPNESIHYRLEIVNNPEKLGQLTIDELLNKYVYHKALHFAPGTGYSYSNTNYWLLGEIIEKVSGKSLQEVLDDLILTPLNMKSTYIDKRPDNNVARGYVDLYGDGMLLDVSRWDRAETDGKAAGGLISTAKDLMLFLQALMEGRIISPVTLELMKKIQFENCSDILCEYGLGLELWRTDAGIGYGHNGSSVGFEANIIYYPSTGNLTVLFKNNGNGSDKSFLDKLMN